ncbi:hypothetical protein SAMN05660328_11528 [Streptococcus gallolyticus]|uniref:Uncharacterized protein n=1 Tax=Streptococcus gallolyticus TaxID=315405 RepID=A0A1I7JM18_9STRE|nr:hypothetical protein [Streptococcus gallolyticus]SFC84525.1 hypothetical protein SAMN02983012_0002 [Streptococcus gallolyticus]SFU86196.1 hypothetical protein SAMN05660328_11528 [Streptococcus gallolyticus]
MVMPNFVVDITAYDVEKFEEFKLILNANEIISIAEDTFEIFDEETGNWVEHKGCEVYVHDCCYKVLNTYETFVELAFPETKKRGARHG